MATTAPVDAASQANGAEQLVTVPQPSPVGPPLLWLRVWLRPDWTTMEDFIAKVEKKIVDSRAATSPPPPATAPRNPRIGGKRPRHEAEWLLAMLGDEEKNQHRRNLLEMHELQRSTRPSSASAVVQPAISRSATTGADYVIPCLCRLTPAPLGPGSAACVAMDPYALLGIERPSPVHTVLPLYGCQRLAARPLPTAAASMPIPDGAANSPRRPPVAAPSMSSGFLIVS